MNRRELLIASAQLLGASAALNTVAANSAESNIANDNAVANYNPVVTLNGSTLPWKMENGFKVFHLIAEPCQREFAKGMMVNAWGYNGSTPGPTIEAMEGDRVRMLVTNKLPASTSVHWHGILLPNGMDGVSGLTQPPIPPGETYVYEFTLRQSGTFMYHPHADETVQMAMGMMGMFIIHPKDRSHKVDRDYCIMLHNWDIEPGAKTPKAATMTEFNLWTMNSRVFPGIDPMVAKLGDRVRIRVGNLSMHDHPMHIHGVNMKVTCTDGGWVPESAQWPETTVLCSGRQHARARIHRRRAGRLAVPLPQNPPCDERHGPRRSEHARRAPTRRGKSRAATRARLHGHGRKRHGRDGGNAHGVARQHTADDGRRRTIRPHRHGWHVHDDQSARQFSSK